MVGIRSSNWSRRSADVADGARCLSSWFGRHLPDSWRSSGKRVIEGEVALRNLGGGLGLTVLVTGSVDGSIWDSCHRCRVVQSRCCQPAIAVAPRRRGRFPELPLEAGDVVAGGGELGGLGEGFGDVVAGVGGFGG